MSNSTRLRRWVFLSTPSARRATPYQHSGRTGRADFYPRPPRGGRQINICNHRWLYEISIHALREEGDLFYKDGEVSAEWISIHALREEGDRAVHRPLRGRKDISIHALREEGDDIRTQRKRASGYFYPRPPRGGRLILVEKVLGDGQFLSTPSARRATGKGQSAHPAGEDFYPRPPRGGRQVQLSGFWPFTANFYPRPPRGGRLKPDPAHWLPVGFLSTPSARRATGRDALVALCFEISIHALREEGDGIRQPFICVYVRFLSTPSARRATCPRGWLQSACAFLSTPSARRATRVILVSVSWDDLFLSTPSARRATSPPSTCPPTDRNFYPRPPRGGRHVVTIDFAGNIGFLSTPSARRATAKTETKSLFSNKLYNILHEFRRALIYNGSKNDPNHAK